MLEALHELYPDAPVFTSVYLPQFLGPHRERFEDWDIRTSWLQYLPFKEKLISPFRVIAPLVFQQFDFSGYDTVIVSATGAYQPNMIRIRNQESGIKERNPLHICYCHTPPHYLYGYMTAREWKKNWVVRVIGEIANHFLRLVDYKSAQNVDFFIANSQEVASRIKKFYRREAVVVYPPVKAPVSSIQYTVLSKKEHTQYRIPHTVYYLTGGRLARAKGVDIIIEAFRKNKKPLKVFGRGFGDYQESRIKNQESGIEYLGEVTDEEKFELMQNAKAFVFASFDEDFGITPVEAMAMGTPVIAYNSGGVKETVIDPSAPFGSAQDKGSGQVQTGVLYNKNRPEELNRAIKEFEKLSISPEDCKAQAAKFSKKRFMEEIKTFIETCQG